MKHSNSIECWRFWLIQSAQHPWKWLEVRWSIYRWTVARLYMTIEFWPRTSAAASRGTQTTITTVSQKTSGLYQWPPCPYLFCPGFQDRTNQRKFISQINHQDVLLPTSSFSMTRTSNKNILATFPFFHCKAVPLSCLPVSLYQMQVMMLADSFATASPE